ncbi:MAG: hypothetical protein ACREO3_11040 [Arenimonas sp.]
MDTNVPIVANGRPDPSRGGHQPSIDCRKAAVMRLMTLMATGTVVLDLAGEIEDEYQRHLNPSGQPGVGDRFFLQVINSAPGRIERANLPLSASGDYEDFPTDPALVNFDHSDRKFAALSRREGIPVVTATDSDWVEHRDALVANAVAIDFVCGCDRANWFAS